MTRATNRLGAGTRASGRRQTMPRCSTLPATRVRVWRETRVQTAAAGESLGHGTEKRRHESGLRTAPSESWTCCPQCGFEPHPAERDDSYVRPASSVAYRVIEPPATGETARWLAPARSSTRSSRLLKNTRIGLFSWPSCVSRPPRQRCARGHAVPTRGPATPAAGDQGHLASRFRNRTKL